MAQIEGPDTDGKKVVKIPTRVTEPPSVLEMTIVSIVGLAARGLSFSL